MFSRSLETDGVSARVLVAMDQGEGTKTIPVFGVFPDAAELVDAYSGETGMVTNGEITLEAGLDLVLLSERQ